MSRRKPLPRVAVVLRGAGEDHVSAVFRKAAERALAAVAAQAPDASAFSAPFTAGYVAGYARQEGLRHGVDAETGSGQMRRLVAALADGAVPALADGLKALQFQRRAQGVSSRSHLQAGDMMADAGYLVGQLEALCGTVRLLAPALHDEPGPAALYLTACDHAADRLQTHQPTASLRFTEDERTILRAAFSA